MAEETGRNDPCPCGSGKKYKKCCLAKKSAKRTLSAKVLNPSALGLPQMIMSQGKGNIEAEESARKKKEQGTTCSE